METVMLPAEAKDRREQRITRALAFLAALDPKLAYEIVVKRFVRNRSSQQNRYERGVCCILLANKTGYEPDEIHEYLCGTYWGWTQRPCPKTPSNPNGVKDVPIRTTTKDIEGRRCVLSKLEFWDFVEFIQRFGAKHGVVIPDPDPEYATRHERPQL